MNYTIHNLHILKGKYPWKNMCNYLISNKNINDYIKITDSYNKFCVCINKKHICRKVLSLSNFRFIVIIILTSLFCKFNNSNIESNRCFITLKTNKTGEIKILSDNFKYNANEVWINNINKSIVTNKYSLNDSESNITLIFYEKLTTLEYMFSGCKDIIEINLSNFDTSQATNASYMFYECTSLISLDISNFNTSQITDMGCLFLRCQSLISLNLSNFDTSKVTNMGSMFSQCTSLISLDLSNFNTSKVNFIVYMFSGCTSLLLLDLSNFDISNINLKNNMFSECSKLQFINMENSNINDQNMFNSNSDNLVVCSNKFVNVFSENISINCINNTLKNENIIKCYAKKKNIYNKYICQICGPNFYQKYNETNDYDKYINCYESKDINCPFYFYFNLTSNIFYCTNDVHCPNSYSLLVPNSKECIKANEIESTDKSDLFDIDNDKKNKSINL